MRLFRPVLFGLSQGEAPPVWYHTASLGYSSIARPLWFVALGLGCGPLMESSVSDLGSSWGDRSSSSMSSPVNVTSYASVISMDTAATDADLTQDSQNLSETHNALDDDMPTVERDLIHLYNVLPQRPLSAFPQSSADAVKDIFADLKDIGINATVVKCFQRRSLGNYCFTFLNEDNRKTFLKKSSFIPHFVRGNPTASSLSSLVYVAVYDASYELKDEAIKLRLNLYGIVKSARCCRLQSVPDVLELELECMAWRSPRPSLPMSVLGSTLLKGLGHAILGNFSTDRMVIELIKISK